MNEEITATRWRKKPVVIDAVQWNRHGDDTDVVPYLQMRPDAAPCDQCDRPLEDHGWIATLEDGHRVCPGDRLITGVAGERYPCKPDIFAATYEPAGAVTPEPERDLSNAQLVGRDGYGTISVALPRVRMTREEALVHAAWLVVITGGELEISGIIAAIGGAQ